MVRTFPPFIGEIHAYHGVSLLREFKDTTIKSGVETRYSEMNTEGPCIFS